MKIYYWTFETQYLLLFDILTYSLAIIYIYDWKLGILFLTQITNSFFWIGAKDWQTFFMSKEVPTTTKVSFSLKQCFI